MPEQLSICIPTYKRPEHLARLLGNIVVRMGKIPRGAVRVYVSDNASGDKTPAVVNLFRAKLDNIYLNINDVNIGMMNNFVKLLEAAEGEYLWLIGDDDEIVPSDGLEKIYYILNNNNPDLLVFLEKNLFDNGQNIPIDNYIGKYASAYPHALLAHTWITSNIIKRNVFDRDFARNKLDTFYMHMYGIMKGLKDRNGKVYIVTDHIVKPCDDMGFRDSSFPDLRRKWIEYFRFLAKLYNQPALIEYSKQWKPGMKEQIEDILVKYKKYLKPRNYYRWFYKKINY